MYYTFSLNLLSVTMSTFSASWETVISAVCNHSQQLIKKKNKQIRALTHPKCT